MAEHPPQEWRIVIGKTGSSCEIFCNGVKLLNVQAADLHLEAGAPSTLHLRLAGYAPRYWDHDPLFQPGDGVEAQGVPMVTSFVGPARRRSM